MRIRVGRADLAPGTMRGHAEGRERFVLVANLAGRYFAIDGWCNHAGCLLANGLLAGAEVTCPCHGMTFDVRTGAVTSRPRLCEDQRTYPVSIEGGEVFVEVE
jgi:3-phenylpropionate/trans-cinnamate dioxygenase ferredoxin subunit